MLRSLGCLLARNTQRFHCHERPVKQEVSSHIAQQSLESLRKAYEKHHAKIVSEILPYMPEPGDADYEEWLVLFEKAFAEVVQAAKGHK
ncbi:MAG: hypothetical protein HW387_1794 [Parachlamydiales bacterium]|nr:hypothetical protein [Parachlamydiales bacterium]